MRLAIDFKVYNPVLHRANIVPFFTWNVLLI
jgi:hypothetical protein